MKRSTLSLILAAGLLVHPGCSFSIGEDFLGLEDYQRDLLFGVGSLALNLLLPPPGPQVAAATACWDANGNGAADVEEDTNGDGLFDVVDCVGATGPAGTSGTAGPVGDPGPDGADGDPGPAGPQGQDGVDCWDTNGNGAADAAEDINNDGAFDVQDCRGTGGGQTGPAGPAGPGGPSGPAGPIGPAGPNLCNAFIDDLFGVNVILTAEALQSGGGIQGPIPTQIEEPALGVCADVDAVVTIAYKWGVSESCTAGNPLTMRLFFWREGFTKDNCQVWRLDAFRASHGTTVTQYGTPRFIEVVDPAPGQDGVLIVIDLPLNVALGSGLGFPNDLQPGDLLAFEVNTEDDFEDGRCYTMLGVEFFETALGNPVGVDKAVVHTTLDAVECIRNKITASPARV